MPGQSSSLSFTFLVIIAMSLSLMVAFTHIKQNLDNVRLHFVHTDLVQ